MRSSLPLLALAATAFAAPQAVTEEIRPKGDAPDGCKTSYNGKFEVTIYGKHSKRDAIEKRSCNGEGVLVMTLKDGVLKDAQDRIGYISESYQFQFDGPPQSGSLFTAGFSVCSSGSLALGSSSTFYQCKSGDFYNLYDRDWAEQCEPVEFAVIPCGDGAKPAPKRRVVGSSVVATTVVTVVSDGVTREVPTTIAVPMCQIGDGQVQVRTTPCDDMELPIITAPPVSQISDGQLQVPTTAPPAPAPKPQGVPEEPKDAPKESPKDTPAPTPAADKPKEDSGKSVPDTDGEKPAGDDCPAGQDCSPTPAGKEKPADKDCPAGENCSYTPAGEEKPADSDDEDEVLVTDTSAAPARPSATTTTTATGTSKVIKPFRTVATTDEEEEPEETGSSELTSQDDEDAAPAESEGAVSDGFQVLPGVGLALMGGLGALLFL